MNTTQIWQQVVIACDLISAAIGSAAPYDVLECGACLWCIKSVKIEWRDRLQHLLKLCIRGWRCSQGSKDLGWRVDALEIGLNIIVKVKRRNRINQNEVAHAFGIQPRVFKGDK